MKAMSVIKYFILLIMVVGSISSALWAVVDRESIAIVPVSEEMDRRVEVVQEPEKDVEKGKTKGRPVRLLIKLQRSERKNKDITLAIHAYEDDIIGQVVEANLRGWDWVDCDYSKIYFGRENVASKSVKYLLTKSAKPDLSIVCRN